MKPRAKIVLVLVAGIVIGSILYFSAGGSYRRAVEAYKRDLIAKGEKLTMLELAPPTNDTIFHN